MNNLDYGALALLNITKYEDMRDFLAHENMTADDFETERECGYIQCITRGTYNGATDTFTPWELTDENIKETLYHEAMEAEFLEIFWDAEDGGDDDPTTWDNARIIFEFSCFYDVAIIGKDIYTIDK